MSERQEIGLEIYHPAFREGYEFGRCLYFYKKMRLSDKHIVEGILNIAHNPENQRNQKEMYKNIGSVFGLMSACVHPLQVGEEDGKAVEEAFLQEVREKYEAKGEELAMRIQDHWNGSDLLAEELDAPTFVQMRERGKKRHLFLEEEGEEKE
jgi:hypothetical protein